jgi:hypothetical protein
MALDAMIVALPPEKSGNSSNNRSRKPTVERRQP